MLARFNAYMSTLESFRADATVTQTLRISGRQDVTTSALHIWVKQPRKTVWATQYATSGMVSYCNGTTMTVFRPALGRYSQAPLAADLTAPVAPAVSQFGEEFAALFTTGPAEILQAEKPDASEMEPTSGVRMLRLKRPTQVMDLYFAESQPPVPFLIRSVKAWDNSADPDKPVKRGPRDQSTFDAKINWMLKPQIPDSQFEFSPPAGARLVTGYGSALSDTTQPLQRGEKFPEVELSLAAGGTLQTSETRGSILVIDFWATWCHGCPRSLESLTKITRDYESKGVKVYAANVKETSATVAAFLKENHLGGLNVAFDAEAKAAAACRVESIPQAIIVGKDGRVIATHVGLSPESASQLTHDLDEALHKK